MKIIHAVIGIVLVLLTLPSCSKQGDTNSTFFVRGNCEMCKERIESTASSVKGVSQATWDIDSKQLSVVFDSKSTSEMDIQQAVAAVGHGTKAVAMDEDAHQELPECCQVKGSMDMEKAAYACCKKKCCDMDRCEAMNAKFEAKCNDKCCKTDGCKKNTNGCCKG